MVTEDVLGIGQDAVDKLATRRGLCDPRRRSVDIKEDRAGHAYGAQDVGENIALHGETFETKTDDQSCFPNG